MAQHKPIEVPIPGVDRSKPDVSDYVLGQIYAGLLIPNKQTGWLMARELKRLRVSNGGQKAGNRSTRQMIQRRRCTT